jgi:hypothetical protein
VCPYATEGSAVYYVLAFRLTDELQHAEIHNLLCHCLKEGGRCDYSPSRDCLRHASSCEISSVVLVIPTSHTKNHCEYRDARHD